MWKRGSERGTKLLEGNDAETGGENLRIVSTGDELRDDESWRWEGCLEGPC